MTSRAFGLLLVVVLVAAPAVARGGQKQQQQQQRTGRPAETKVQKALRIAKRIPHQLNRARKLAYTGGIGKVATAMTALGALQFAGGPGAGGRAAAALTIATLFAGLNVAMRVSSARFEAQAQRRMRAQEDHWAHYDDDFGPFADRMRSEARGEAPPPRPARTADVAAALAYFGVAHLDKAAAKEAAKKIYRRKARELHPDVAVPRGVPKEKAERAFSELANHYSALDDL